MLSPAFLGTRHASGTHTHIHAGEASTHIKLKAKSFKMIVITLCHCDTMMPKFSTLKRTKANLEVRH